MHPIHPMVVHFPIALLIASVIFDLVSQWWRRQSFQEAAFYTLVAGLVGVVAAVVTGAMAEETAENTGIPEAILDTHEVLGYATLWFFVGLLGFRIGMRRGWLREPLGWSVALGIVGVGALVATGYYGGSLVYEFGAGVLKTVQALP